MQRAQTDKQQWQAEAAKLSQQILQQQKVVEQWKGVCKLLTPAAVCISAIFGHVHLFAFVLAILAPHLCCQGLSKLPLWLAISSCSLKKQSVPIWRMPS